MTRRRSADPRAFWERTARRYDLSMQLLGGPMEALRPLVTEEVRGLGRVLELAAGTVSAQTPPLADHDGPISPRHVRSLDDSRPEREAQTEAARAHRRGS